jgi:hypothetical protein
MKQVLDRGVPLIDHPEYLVTYAAEAWREGDPCLDLRESPGVRRLRGYLESPEELDARARAEIVDWIQKGAHGDHDAVLDELGTIGPRIGPPFCSREVLAMPMVNDLLAEKVPVVTELGLSGDDVMRLSDVSDIWKAYRAMVGFTIDAGIDRMPERRPAPTGGRPQRRPGGPDIRQAVNLGVCGTFVLRDDWLEESLRRIASGAGLDRRIVRTDDFFEELLSR